MRTLIIFCLLLAGGVGYTQTCSGTTTITFCDPGDNIVGDGSGQGTYSDNMDCFWLFNPVDGIPEIRFTDFSVEGNDNPSTFSFDYVAVYDGTNTNAPLIGQFDNDNPPGVILTGTSGSLYLHFHTDFSEVREGWTLEYSCFPDNNVCSDVLPLDCGETNFGNNFSTGNNWDWTNYSCANLPANVDFYGNDVVYEINHFGGPFSVSLFNDDNLDFDIFLFNDCNNVPPAFSGETTAPDCINSSILPPRASGRNIDNLYYPALASGTYYVVVDAQFASTLGSFRLTYNCEEFLSSDETIECGETYFHSNRRGNGYTNEVANYCGQAGIDPGAGCTGPERVYIFFPPETGIYTFTLTPNTSGQDFELFLLDNLGGDDIGVYDTSVFGCLEDPPTLGTTDQGEEITVFLNARHPLSLARHEVYLVVDGFDGDEGDYTLTVSCPSVCDDPVFSFNCGTQEHYELANGDYRFTTSASVAPGEGWVVDGIVQPASGASLTYDPTPGQSYEVCYPYLDGDGCVNYCCRSYCIESDNNPPVAYDYSADGTSLSLSLNESGTSSASWYYYNGSTRVGAGSGTSIVVPVPTNCFSRTYYVRYFRNGCWRTYSRNVYVCNPYFCNDIDYDYDRTTGRFNLSFTGTGSTPTITWLDDDAGGSTITTGTSVVSIPRRSGSSCGERNISLRYYDGSAWRVCCLRYWDCDPYLCGNINVALNGAETAYVLTFTGTNSAQQLSWTDDATGQALPGGNGSRSVSIPVPVNGCVTRYISVRYYDPATGTYRICCIEREFCPPFTCDDPVFSFNCGTQEHYELANGDYRFTTSASVAPGEGWVVDGIVQPASGASLTYDPTPGQSYEVCYPYLDSDGCVNYCCRSYCVETDNNPPVAYNYSADGTLLSLSLTETGASSASWYYYNGSTRVGAGNGSSIVIPVPTNCFSRTYYVRYFRNGCWRTYSRNVYVCNPYFCDDIDYDYNRTTGRFNLSFNGTAVTSTITWLDDDAGGSTITTGTSVVSIPRRSGSSCGERNISLRYYDGSAWRVCCLRYWDCDPYLCGNINVALNGAETAYVLTFTGTNSAQQLSWTDDATGQALPGGNGSRSVLIPVPVNGCVTRYISVRYYDPSTGTYRLCCIEREFCPPFTCDDPVFSFNCGSQNHYELTNRDYRFTTSASVAAGEGWTVNGTIQPGSGSSLTYDPTPGQSYEVCYPYLDSDGCVNYCCRTYCIEADNDPPVPTIDFIYQRQGNTYDLTLTVVGSEALSWYYLDNNVPVPSGTSRTIVVSIPVEGCFYRTFYCRYLDADGCWRIASREIYLCSPFACGNIAYRFDPQMNAFALTLEASEATQLSWHDDDNNVPLPGTEETIFVPLGAVCGSRNISVRYFDGRAWRICCLRYEACNPFLCGRISPRYEAEEQGYRLTLTDVDGMEQFQWSDDADPNVVFTSTTADLFVPVSGPCRERQISVRYYDPVRQLWHICCVRYFSCSPAACGDFIAFSQGTNNIVTLTTDTGFEQVLWEIEGAAAGAGNVIEAEIGPGQSRTVCVRFFDPINGYFRTCCRTVTIPDCDLPVPTFTIRQNLDSIMVVNDAPGADVSYFWEFGEVAESTLSQPPALHLPPGRHLICLTVTNSCGSQRICREVLIPDLANDLIFYLDAEVCGQPGTVVDIPLRVRNFTEISAFQFTMNLPTPRLGALRGITFQGMPGSPFGQLANDSTLLVVWSTVDLSNTLLDGTVIATIQVELSSSSGAATASLEFSDFPTERLVEYGTGVEGVPVTLLGDYGICPANGNISGQILREDGAGVGLVNVGLYEAGQLRQEVTTDASGSYTFSGLTPGLDYEIIPIKDINYRNGVNSGDLGRIRRHIFRSPLLSSPYQRIAADVNNPGNVTAGDLTSVRQLIFRTTPEFADVNSWEFVSADYVFPDPDRPSVPAYPKSVTFTAVSGDLVGVDFIGMKMGDVGDSADPASFSGRGLENKSASDLKFFLEGSIPMRGQEYQVDVRVSDFTEMYAAQFSFGWDSTVLRFDRVSDLNAQLELNENNFSLDGVIGGQLPWLWFGAVPTSLPDSTVLFSLYFNVIGEVGEEIAIRFTEEPTEYFFEDAEAEISADLFDLREVIELPTGTRRIADFNHWKVYPNPAVAWFRVQASGEGKQPETLTLLDSHGRQVRHWRTAPGGQYSLMQLPAGIYWLRMSSEGRQLVRRLVIVK